MVLHRVSGSIDINKVSFEGNYTAVNTFITQYYSIIIYHYHVAERVDIWIRSLPITEKKKKKQENL